MPIWEPSLRAAGFLPDEISTTIHILLPAGLDASFLLHLGPLADVIPIPLPFIQNVASVGDAFLTAGLAFFLFAGIVREPQELSEEQLAAIRQRLAGLTPVSPPCPGPLPDRRPGDRAVTGHGRQRRPRSSVRAGRRRPADVFAGIGLARPGGARPRDPRSAPRPRSRRAGPPASVRPARPQRLLLGPVDGPADLAVRRSAQPDRARLGRADLDGLAARHRPGLRGRHPARTSC